MAIIDENETFGALSQIAPQSVAAAPMAASAQAASQQAPAPQPSEYEKAIAGLQKQRQELIATQQKMLESLESRVVGPQQMMFALASGFLGPTRSGGFGEAVGRATESLGQFQNQQRQQMSDISKMRLELQLQELGMREKDVELAKTQEMRNALNQMTAATQTSGVAGSPAAGGMVIPPSVIPILNVMKVMNPEAAIKYIADLAKDDAKRPDAVKAAEIFISMLPPEMQNQARSYVARSNVFGKPSESSESRMKIYERLRSGSISPEIAAKELAMLEVPSMSGVSTGATAAPSAAPAPSIPRVIPGAQTAVGTPPSRSPLSPQAQEDVAKAEITEDIKARAGAREQAYKKMEEDLRASESSASAAVSTINSLNRFLEASPSASAGGLQPLFTNVKNLLSSFGISADSLVNEQKMAAAIDQVLLGKMESMGSAARGLTDKDMEMMRNSLPRLNTDRRAREEIAKIIMKSKANDLEDYRVRRVNESENFPEMARVRVAPRFYMDWIRRTRDFEVLKDQYGKATTQQAKDDVMRRFDAYYGLGVARQMLR